MTSSQTLKFWSRLRSPASKPCYLNISSDGQVMSPEWRTIAYTENATVWRTLHRPQRERRAHMYKKRYKDCLKKSLTACHVDHQCWSDLAADRSAWRHPDPPAVTEFEEGRRDALKDKRQRRKAATPDVTCRHCPRICLSRIRLVSHERT